MGSVRTQGAEPLLQYRHVGDVAAGPFTTASLPEWVHIPATEVSMEGQMNARRFVIGTLVGGAILFATGYLIFPMAMRVFYAANAGRAADVVRQPLLVWAVAIGVLSYSALITLAIGSRAGSLNVGTGIKSGAVIGFLLFSSADFMLFGITNIMNLTSTVLDLLLELVHGAIAGGVIAAVLGKIR